MAADIDAGDGFLAPLIGLGAHLKRVVPEPAHRPEPVVQHPHLRGVGIAAEAVRALYDSHAPIISRIARITPRWMTIHGRQASGFGCAKTIPRAMTRGRRERLTSMVNSNGILKPAQMWIS